LQNVFNNPQGCKKERSVFSQMWVMQFKENVASFYVDQNLSRDKNSIHVF
jgi:hypothetical protein